MRLGARLPLRSLRRSRAIVSADQLVVLGTIADQAVDFVAAVQKFEQPTLKFGNRKRLVGAVQLCRTSSPARCPYQSSANLSRGRQTKGKAAILPG